MDLSKRGHQDNKMKKGKGFLLPSFLLIHLGTLESIRVSAFPPFPHTSSLREGVVTVCLCM